MSSPPAASIPNEPLATWNSLLNHPGADIIIHSQDSHRFQVPKIFILNSSPILSELIRTTVDSPSDANTEALPPVVQLPESGEILHCLFTFVFPVTPLLPSTPEETMKLLSVAQKYQMETALAHIRSSIARYNSLPTRLEPALRIYALAQKYGLRQEALQMAQVILLKQPMTIEDLEYKLDIMPGASLYELWKYYEKVREILASDLIEFGTSCARGTITGLRCIDLSSSQIPSWLDQYIESIGKAPDRFDFAGLNIAMARHTKEKANEPGCECASMSSQTINEFWEALSSAIHGGFDKVSVSCGRYTDPKLLRMLNFVQAESALSLVQDQEYPKTEISLTASPLKPFDVSDTNLVIRSSDLVDFRVHKSVLAMASPFFEDLLSLPQPSDSEIVDGLPVVQFSESSELLNSLLSFIYPVRGSVLIPNSYEKVL